MRYAAADFKEDYNILIFTKQSQITMINGTKSIEYIYTATRKNAGRDACIGAAFSSYTNQEVI